HNPLGEALRRPGFTTETRQRKQRKVIIKLSSLLRVLRSLRLFSFPLFLPLLVPLFSVLSVVSLDLQAPDTPQSVVRRRTPPPGSASRSPSRYQRTQPRGRRASRRCPGFGFLRRCLTLMLVTS